MKLLLLTILGLMGSVAVAKFDCEVLGVLTSAYSNEELDKKIEVIKYEGIEYPSQLKRGVIKGKVTCLVFVNEDGKVVSVSALDFTAQVFVENCLKGISTWEFSPGFKDGEKVTYYVKIPIIFDLSGAPKNDKEITYNKTLGENSEPLRDSESSS